MYQAVQQKIKKRMVTADANLEIMCCKFKGLTHPITNFLRMAKALEACFDQGIYHDNFSTFFFGIPQRCEHARMVRARIMADQKDHLGINKIADLNGSLTCANSFFKRDAR